MADPDKSYQKLKKETEDGGYLLNPDKEFVIDLISGLETNQVRYGYQSCPCRLAEGKKDADLDIICPCDYRDPDLSEYDACFCGLYVTEEVASGKKDLEPVPERRPETPDEPKDEAAGAASVTGTKYPVWRCKVCGYLSARDSPPEVCPICKAKKERFEIFISAR